MIYIDFIKRKTKPTNPQSGYFYWVEKTEGVELYFSPTTESEDLILLNGDNSEHTSISEVTETEDGYVLTLSDETTLEIKNGKDGENGKSAFEIWQELDGNSDKSIDDFFDMLKENSEPYELTEEDIDKIVEKVSSKTIDLKWTII